MDKLKILTIFVKVVDSGSFSCAAIALGQSPSTVSKAISRLESEIGVKIFDRNTRQLRLTEAGQRYYETARNVIRELEECEEFLNTENSRPAGSLRINMPTAYGRLYLTPFLEQFQDEFPDIVIDAMYTDDHINIIENGYDISIRSGQVGDSRLIARQLSPIDFVICGSPEYFEKHGVPENKAQLAEKPWVYFRYSQTGRVMPITLPDSSVIKSSGCPVFVVNDGETMVELCANGRGLIQAPHFLVKEKIESGELKILLPPVRQPGFGVFAIYLKKENMPTKTRSFIERLQKYLEEKGETPYNTWAQSLEPMLEKI